MYRFFAIAVLVFLLIPVRATGDEDPKFQLDSTWRERAQWYYRKGQMIESMRIHQKLLAKYPNNYWPYFCLAHCYRNLGLYDQAMQYFRQAKRWNPGVPDIDLRIAKCYEAEGIASLSQGDDAKAIEIFTKGVEARPDYWKNYHWIGCIHLYHAQYDQAIPWLIRARDTNPVHYYLPYANLGLCYLKLDQKDLAKEELEEAERLNPASASTHFNLGLLYARQGLWPKAWDEFHLAVTMGVSKDTYKPRTA